MSDLGLSSYGSLQEGYARGNAAEFNANVARQNAELTRQQTIEDERRFRVQTRKALGGLKTAYSASGVTQGGSVLDVLQESAANAELDALTMRHAGETKRIGFLNEAMLQDYAAKYAIKGAKINAAASLLKSGSDAAIKLSGGGA